MALASIRWFSEAEGGRKAPPPGPTYAATAVFVLGGDAEVQPGWPAAGEHFSVMLDSDDLGATCGKSVRVEFLARALVADQLRVGSEFLVMEGSAVVAEACVTEVYDDPTSVAGD